MAKAPKSKPKQSSEGKELLKNLSQFRSSPFVHIKHSSGNGGGGAPAPNWLYPPFPVNPFFVWDPMPDDFNGHYGKCMDGYPSYILNDDDFLEVYIYFSSVVDISSVLYGRNFLVIAKDGHLVPGTFTWQTWAAPGGVSNSLCIFTSTEPWEKVLLPEPDGWFTVELFGADQFNLKANPPYFFPGIRDIRGLHLDGDYSGSFSGGEYSNWFFLIG
jgi:hypothetical protein